MSYIENTPTPSFFRYIKNLSKDNLTTIRKYIQLGLFLILSSVIIKPFLSFNISGGKDVFFRELTILLFNFSIVASLLYGGYKYLYNTIILITKNAEPKFYKSEWKILLIVALSFFLMYIPLTNLLFHFYICLYSKSRTFRNFSFTFLIFNFGITFSYILYFNY